MSLEIISGHVLKVDERVLRPATGADPEKISHELAAALGTPAITMSKCLAS